MYLISVGLLSDLNRPHLICVPPLISPLCHCSNSFKSKGNSTCFIDFSSPLTTHTHTQYVPLHRLLLGLPLSPPVVLF